MSKTLVIYGFLGSGKTTLIKHLLSEVLSYQRVVVVENELGRESIDSLKLRNLGGSIVDMKSGCVCCTLRSELVTTLAPIEQEIKPDVVILEPSGLSSLEDIIKIPKFTISGVIAIIDVSRFDLLMQLNRPFYTRQFQLAPVIILNQKDADSKLLANTVRELSIINPWAQIVTDYHSLPHSWWGEDVYTAYEQFSSYALYSEYKTPQFHITTIDLHGGARAENMQRLMSALKAHNLMPLRIKGVILGTESSVVVDAVGESLSMESLSVVPYDKSFLSFWWAEQGDMGLLKQRLQTLLDSIIYERG